MKDRKHIIFRTKKTTIIINKHHKILVLNMWNNKNKTSYISMNNLETSRRMTDMQKKGNDLILPSLHDPQSKDKVEDENIFLCHTWLLLIIAVHIKET